MQKIQDMWVRSLGQEDPLEEETAIHYSILPDQSHGQRSLVGYSSKDCKELNMIEQLHLHTRYKMKILWKKVHLKKKKRKSTYSWDNIWGQVSEERNFSLYWEIPNV